MSKDNESKQEKKERKRLKGCEHESDRRTARFLAEQLGDVQERLCDLINDMRTFEHYSEIDDAGCCLYLMQRLKKKYRSFAQDGVWPDASSTYENDDFKDRRYNTIGIGRRARPE